MKRNLILLVALIMIGGISCQDKLENLRSADGNISVAVMPIINLTNDGTLNIWQDGIHDILITSLDKKKTYRENLDYEVIEGSIVYPYSTDARPSKILRVPGGSIKNGETVLVSYDYVVRKCSFAEWSIPYCPSSERTYEIMNSVIKNTIETFGPKYIDIGHDEIRGMNRDSRCLKRNLTNAQLLAEDINKLYSMAKTYDPEVKLLMWSDMLNPWHNGGDENYQVQFGGKKGKTSHAIDFIPKDIIILLWNNLWHLRTVLVFLENKMLF